MQKVRKHDGYTKSAFIFRLPILLLLLLLLLMLLKGKVKAVPLQAWTGPEGS